MTNSLLAYMDARDGPQPFRFRGSDTVVVPTILSDPDKPIVERLIGNAALRFQFFAENFKIGLPLAGTTDAQRLKSRDFRAAKAFIENIIYDFRSSSAFEGIAAIVVTVPESWLSGAEQSGADAVRQIFRDLQLAQVRLVSEPVAAAAYFAYKHRKKVGEPFDGHVLVYDHGGGTLDICVVRVQNREIKVVSGLGLSRDMTRHGFGGVAFDRLVFEQVKKRHRPAPEVLSAKNRDAWVREFERLKRNTTDDIERKWKSKRLDQRTNERVFNVLGTDVLLSDLLTVFERDFAPNITKELDNLIAHAKSLAPTMNMSNADRFRVVSVGGFSEFYPIQKLLQDYFNTNSGTSKVLEDHIVGSNRQDKWLAIAKGASLIAGEEMALEQSCPFTFGIVYFVGHQKQYGELLTLGRPASDWREPQFFRESIELARLTSEYNSVIFYMERAGRKEAMPMKRSFADVLPDHDVPKMSWQIGCRIDADGVVSVIFKPASGKRPKIVKMGPMIAMVDGRVDEIVLD